MLAYMPFWTSAYAVFHFFYIEVLINADSFYIFGIWVISAFFCRHIIPVRCFSPGLYWPYVFLTRFHLQNVSAYEQKHLLFLILPQPTQISTCLLTCSYHQHIFSTIPRIILLYTEGVTYWALMTELLILLRLLMTKVVRTILAHTYICLMQNPWPEVICSLSTAGIRRFWKSGQ